MVASTDIKFFVHSNNNAPQLQNAFGSMIGVLDACLVNGISLGLVSTLTAVGTTVTAVFSASHNLMQFQVIKIVGANQAEYNGEHRILTVPNATSVTFQLASAPSVTTATGSITASLPSLGWENPFSVNANGGGKAAYRSKNTLLPSRPYLRVVDELDPAYTATYAKFAKVGIVEDMADINTMLGVQAPYDSTSVNKNWVGTGTGTSAINGWAKWYYATDGAANVSFNEATPPKSGSRTWILVGSTDYFYILPATDISNIIKNPYGFGAFDSLLQSDSAANFLSASYDYRAASATNARSEFMSITSSSGAYLLLQRAYNQSAQFKVASCLGLGVASSVNSGVGNYIGNVSLTNIAPFSPVYIKEDVLRGVLKNIYWLYQISPYTNLQIIENKNQLFMAVGVSAQTSPGQVVLKIGDL